MINPKHQAWWNAVLRYNIAMIEARKGGATFSVADTYAGENLPEDVAQLRSECIRLHTEWINELETAGDAPGSTGSNGDQG